jgi:hypothetical protein
VIAQLAYRRAVPHAEELCAIYLKERADEEQGERGPGEHEALERHP